MSCRPDFANDSFWLQFLPGQCAQCTLFPLSGITVKPAPVRQILPAWAGAGQAGAGQAGRWGGDGKERANAGRDEGLSRAWRQELLGCNAVLCLISNSSLFLASSISFLQAWIATGAKLHITLPPLPIALIDFTSSALVIYLSFFSYTLNFFRKKPFW